MRHPIVHIDRAVVSYTQVEYLAKLARLGRWRGLACLRLWGRLAPCTYHLAIGRVNYDAAVAPIANIDIARLIHRDAARVRQVSVAENEVRLLHRRIRYNRRRYARGRHLRSFLFSPAPLQRLQHGGRDYLRG